MREHRGENTRKCRHIQTEIERETWEYMDHSVGQHTHEEAAVHENVIARAHINGKHGYIVIHFRDSMHKTLLLMIVK